MYFCTLCKSMDRSNVSVAKKLSLHNGKANFARAQHALETLEFVEYIVHLIKRRGNFLVIDSANNGEQNCHWRFFFLAKNWKNHSYYVNTNRCPLATLNCCTTTQLLQKRRDLLLCR